MKRSKVPNSGVMLGETIDSTTQTVEVSLNGNDDVSKCLKYNLQK